MDNAETRKEKVNEYAEKLYKLRAQAGSKEEQKNLFSKLCEAVIQDIPMLMKKYYPVKEDEVWDIVIDLLYYEFPPDMREKWKPDLGPFMGCFRFLCKARLKGYLKEHSASATDDEDGTTQLKKAPVQRVQPKIDSETGEENDLLGKIADNSQHVEAEFQVPADEIQPPFPSVFVGCATCATILVPFPKKKKKRIKLPTIRSIVTKNIS